MSETKNPISAGDLLARLRAGALLVTFTKVDGSDRVMRCTLNPDLAPSVRDWDDPESDGRDVTNIVVYDLDAAGVRSFRLDRVVDVRDASCPECGVA